jgi:hypothetical protein
MTTLLEVVVNAHGGVERWKKIQRIRAEIRVGGALWQRKGWPDVFSKGVQVTADPHTQWASFWPFLDKGTRSSCTPESTIIETTDGGLVKERSSPRAAFEGHTGETRWDDLHLAYFSAYAMWNYLTAPFMFLMTGVKTEEIEPWRENGEPRRRLRVVFPDDIATHCPEQIFHVNEEGLICRMDYSAPVTGSGPIAHYLHDHKDFSGIKFATRRRTLRRKPDGNSVPEPIVVAIDISDIGLS